MRALVRLPDCVCRWLVRLAGYRYADGRGLSRSGAASLFVNRGARIIRHAPDSRHSEVEVMLPEGDRSPYYPHPFRPGCWKITFEQLEDQP